MALWNQLKLCLLPCFKVLQVSLFLGNGFQPLTLRKLSLLVIVGFHHQFAVVLLILECCCATCAGETLLLPLFTWPPLWNWSALPHNHHLIEHHPHVFFSNSSAVLRYLSAYWLTCFWIVAPRIYGLGPDPKITLVNNTASLFLSRGSHIREGEGHLYLLGPLLGEYLRWYTTSSDDFEEGCQITWDVKGVLLPNSCSRKVLDNVSMLNNHKLSSSLWTRPGLRSLVDEEYKGWPPP